MRPKFLEDFVAYKRMVDPTSTLTTATPSPSPTTYEVEYDKLTGGDHTFLHMTDLLPNQKDVLTRSFLIKHYNLMKSVMTSGTWNILNTTREVTDTITGNKYMKTFYMDDVCSKIATPAGLESFEQIIPCTRMR